MNKGKIILAAITLAIFVMFALGHFQTLDHLYSPNEAHRVQVQAFLLGELSLSRNPFDISHDHTWSAGGVNQVWGLGVPILQLPFSGSAGLFGFNSFPERVTWLFYYTLFIFLTFLVGQDWIRQESRGGLAVILTFCLFPPFIGLVGSRFQIYEEVVAYAYLAGMIQLLGLARLTKQWSHRLWLVCCAISGFGMFIRPTLVAEAFSTLVVGSMVGKQHRAGAVSLAAGWALCGAIGLLLYAANYMRFENGFEFGHAINLQGPSLTGSLFSTHFQNSFASCSQLEALKELCGFLFFSVKQNGNSHYDEGLFWGQSPLPRWRESYLTAYDWSYLIFILASAALLFYSFHKWKKKEPQTGIGFSPWINLWAALTTFLLVVFYFKAPVIASRYLLDFATPFAVFAGGFWYFFIGKFHRVGIAAALLWMVWEIYSSFSIYGPPQPQNFSLNNPDKKSGPPVVLSDSYDSAVNARKTKLPYNGSGWNMETGETASICIFWTKNASRIRLDLEWKRAYENQPDPRNTLRARLGGRELRIVHVHHEGKKSRITFENPGVLADKLEILFLKIGTLPEFNSLNCGWKLEKIRWE